MALSALGRSRVMTATPFGWTFPLTNSSAPVAAMVANVLELPEVCGLQRDNLMKRQVDWCRWERVIVVWLKRRVDDLEKIWETESDKPRMLILRNCDSPRVNDNLGYRWLLIARQILFPVKILMKSLFIYLMVRRRLNSL